MEGKGARTGQRLSKADLTNAENELMIMRFAADPNVLTVYGFAHDVHRTFIVLELAPYGSLWDILKDNSYFPSLPISLMVAWMRDIAHAICVLHRKAIKHLDLKSQNALILNGLTLKICDFGVAKQSSTTGANTTFGSSMAGTLAFMPPEIRNCEKSVPASDIFSLGITAIQILSRAEPGLDDVSGQIEKSFLMAVDNEPNETVWRDLVSLLTQATSRKVDDRPTAAQFAQKLTDILSAAGGDPRTEPQDFVEVIEMAAKQKKKKRRADTNLPRLIGGGSRPSSASISSPSGPFLPLVGDRPNSASNKNAEQNIIIDWLAINASGITLNNRKKYASLIYDTGGAATMKKVASKISKNINWLQTLNIDDDDVEEIIDAMRKMGLLAAAEDASASVFFFFFLCLLLKDNKLSFYFNCVY